MVLQEWAEISPENRAAVERYAETARELHEISERDGRGEATDADALRARELGAEFERLTEEIMSAYGDRLAREKSGNKPAAIKEAAEGARRTLAALTREDWEKHGNAADYGEILSLKTAEGLAEVWRQKEEEEAGKTEKQRCAEWIAGGIQAYTIAIKRFGGSVDFRGEVEALATAFTSPRQLEAIWSHPAFFAAFGNPTDFDGGGVEFGRDTAKQQKDGGRYSLAITSQLPNGKPLPFQLAAPDKLRLSWPAMKLFQMGLVKLKEAGLPRNFAEGFRAYFSFRELASLWGYDPNDPNSLGECRKEARRNYWILAASNFIMRVGSEKEEEITPIPILYRARRIPGGVELFFSTALIATLANFQLISWVDTGLWTLGKRSSHAAWLGTYLQALFYVARNWKRGEVVGSVQLANALHAAILPSTRRAVNSHWKRKILFPFLEALGELERIKFLRSWVIVERGEPISAEKWDRMTPTQFADGLTAGAFELRYALGAELPISEQERRAAKLRAAIVEEEDGAKKALTKAERKRKRAEASARNLAKARAAKSAKAAERREEAEREEAEYRRFKEEERKPLPPEARDLLAGLIKPLPGTRQRLEEDPRRDLGEEIELPF